MKSSGKSASQKRSSSSTTPIEVDESPDDQNLKQNLSSAVNFAKPISMIEFLLLKLGKKKDDHTNYYLLTIRSTGTALIFKISGTVEFMNTNPHRANLNRNTPIKMDQYAVKLSPESDNYATACSNFQEVKRIFEAHPSALFDISKTMNYRTTKQSFLEKPVTLELYGLMNPEELYTAKSVAVPSRAPQKHHMNSFIPNPSDPATGSLFYPKRVFLEGFRFCIRFKRGGSQGLRFP